MIPNALAVAIASPAFAQAPDLSAIPPYKKEFDAAEAAAWLSYIREKAFKGKDAEFKKWKAETWDTLDDAGSGIATNVDCCKVVIVVTNRFPDDRVCFL